MMAKPESPRRWLGGLVLWSVLAATGVSAAPMCRIDPVSRQIFDGGEGGIGGTGAPARPAEPGRLASNGTGGIGGTGSPTQIPLAGHVLFASGTVLAERSDGSQRALVQGSPVCQGDTIDTHSGSLVQLAMADHGQLELRAQSRLRLDTFTLPATMDGSERFGAYLAWGSVRAVTGEIGHLHKELYALNTPVAAVGVRGTTHEVFHVPAALPGVPAGTYNRVLAGKTVLSSAGKTLELLPSQAGFVAGKGVAPRLLEHLPTALAQPSAVPAVFDWRSGASGMAQTKLGDDQVLYLKPLQAITRYYGWLPKSPEGSAYVGASQDLNTNAVQVGGVVSNRGNGSVIVIDPEWGLPYAVADTRNGFNSLIGAGTTLYDVDSAMVDGVSVMWGLYGNTTTVDPVTGAMRAVDYHHFAFAPSGLTPMSTLHHLSGTVNFNRVVGSTMLTDEGGGIGGQVNSLSIGMQFGPQVRVTSYQLNATDGQARNWDAQFNGQVSLHDFRAGKLPLAVQCQGDGCGSGAGQGQASGVVIGQSGKGVITSFGLNTNSGQSVAGAAVVSRP